MRAIRDIFAAFAVFSFGLSAFVAEVYADTHTAASCSYGDVYKVISAASPEDTVSVPAGSCTWSTALTITKGINLIGAGPGNTVITRGGSGNIILYTPSDYRLNTLFRISGFTFNLNQGGTTAVQLGAVPPYHPSPAQTKVRVDHCRFTNGTPGNTSQHAIRHYGAIYGVIDNNTFDSIYYPLKADPGLSGGGSNDYGGQWSWDNWSLTFGLADDNMYVEDNTIDMSAGSSNDTGIVTDCQFSGRYVYRYNTIKIYNETYPLFDMHGNQGGGLSDPNAMWSCFGGELYGNQVIAGNYIFRFLDHRGGEALVFYNNCAGSYQPQLMVTEEHPDSEEPTTNPEPQHVHNTYYWNNRINLTGSFFSVAEMSHNGDDPSIPLVNRDYWYQGSSFDGTSGIGCGTLASRPAICTTGVGYWATDQSCTDLTGLVGVNPKTPISGTLYKCTATNTWTAYYTPYPYPHPLRKPSSPENLKIVE